VFSELKREVMVRTKQYKYAVDAQGAGYLLFDLEQDPHEQRNLIGHPAAAPIERDLRERLLTWLVSTQIERTN
jgi:arylsulfatase A-like enzyme